ncbi:MAG: hypothetical protein U0744_15495 [Gemmataceae bacterium]
MFPGIPHALFRVHDWRNGIAPLGEVPAPFVRAISGGKLDFPMKVEVDRLLTDEPWDAILSIGQLVPHEVIGIANHNKNIFVGVGGSDLINRTHWLKRGAWHRANHGPRQTRCGLSSTTPRNISRSICRSSTC